MATEPLIEDARRQPAPLAAPVDRESFGPARYLNRELSWLDFARRVLELADDSSLPLLERSKFLAIFSTGLDEYFQVRVAGLKNRLDAGRRSRSADGRSVLEILAAVREKVTALVEYEARIFNETVRPGLAAAGVGIVEWATLERADQLRLRRQFETDMFPVLTPFGRRPGAPLPVHLEPLAQPRGLGRGPGLR